MSNVDRGVSAGSQAALTSTYQIIEITDQTTPEARAAAVPDECYLVDMGMHLTSIAGSPSTIEWFLAADANADVPLSPVVTSTIVPGRTTGTRGAVLEALRKDHYRITAGVPGSVYLVAKLDQGTANMVPIMGWRVDR
ncbi:MAG: hypothetical protein V3R84_07710 [Acidimicrobiia bacterium]